SDDCFALPLRSFARSDANGDAKRWSNYNSFRPARQSQKRIAFAPSGLELTALPSDYCLLITGPDCACNVCKLCLTTEARLQNEPLKRMSALSVKTGLRLNEHSSVVSTSPPTKSLSRASASNASWCSRQLLDC